MNSTVLAAGTNFLVPNGTFFVELIIFAVVLGVIGRFVVPPVRDALAHRADVVSKTIDDNHKAAKAFSDAERTYKQELTDARHEASKIRDEARGEGQKVLDNMRVQARQESDSILQRATDDLNEEGDRVSTQLREDVGPLSQSLAERILGSTSDSAAAGSTASRGKG